MTTPTPKHPWYHVTPDRFFIGLLAVQVFLLLSERFEWFAVNENKGWTVLIAIGVVGLAVVVMLVWGLVCVCLRRGFQFGVRTLLVIVVAVSLPLGWFAWELQRARRQGVAVERIKALGGNVFYDYQVDEDGHPVHYSEPTSPTWLRELFGEEFFFEVVTVTCNLKEFGDDDAIHLQELTNLKVLQLLDTPITDKGLTHVGELARLERLLLSETPVTDRGLEHLRGMTRLKRLTIFDTKVTDEGIGRLQQALPDCDIRIHPFDPL